MKRFQFRILRLTLYALRYVTTLRLGLLFLVVATLSFGYVSGDSIANSAPRIHTRVIEQLSDALKRRRELAMQMVPYDVVFRRNPMQPIINEKGELVSSAGLSGGLWIQGIIWSSEHPMAIIDDELFSQNDAIGSYTIVEIRQEGVVVNRNDETTFIPLDRGLQNNDYSD